MASIDYREAKNEITKLFNAENDGRKIIFWYDPPMNFKEDIVSDSFDCCRVLVCENNEFFIKKTIEYDDPDTNYLIYIPSEKPNDADNWLLDILLYSEEYYADTVALTMRRLGLSDPDLRRIVERYASFFDSKERNKRLASYVEVRDGMHGGDLKLGMLCALARAGSRSIESVLTELVFDNGGSRYAEIRKFGFEEFLWDEIAQTYNYEGDQKIEVLIQRFLFTAFLEQAENMGELPSFYGQFTISGVGRMDAKFFIDKLKTDKRYPALQAAVAENLKIEGILTSRTIESFRDADVFECIDQQIINTIAESLKNGSLDYDAFSRIIAGRINSIWYDEHRAEYEMLASTVAFYRALDKPIPKEKLAADYILGYTDSYYLVDLYYRRICASYRCIERPSDEFEWLTVRVEQSYQTNFLELLGKEYSDALKGQDEWCFSGIPSTRDFYRSVQRNNYYKKCFVIVSDGLRYEIARELFEKIKADPVLQGNEEITYAVSPIPSETRFGMAALLPHKKLTYEKGSVYADGMPTNSTSARDTILKAKHRSYAAIGYEDINGLTRSELRSYMADKSLVYIYHDVMDTTGEHNPKKTFDVASTAINELLLLVRKLYNSLQISNFYITADHGFLFRSNTVEESSKYSNVVSLHPIEASKRYVITDDESLSIPYTLEFPLPSDDGAHKIIVPYGYDLFKTQGGGLQYIHGGASLQETIVPIIHISELNASKNKEAVSPVGVRLKSVTRKITNRSFSLDFEQYEKVQGTKQPVTCETYFVDEDGNRVSGSYIFLAASESDDAESRATSIRYTLMNIQFDRNKRYYLILRDTSKPDEYIEREQFVIDILAFKVF